MEVFIESCAGLDVHSETIVACIIKGSREEEYFQETAHFLPLRRIYFVF